MAGVDGEGLGGCEGVMPEGTGVPVAAPLLLRVPLTVSVTVGVALTRTPRDSEMVRVGVASGVPVPDAVDDVEAESPGANESVDDGVTRGDACVSVGEAVELSEGVPVVVAVTVGMGDSDSVPELVTEAARDIDEVGVPVAAADIDALEPKESEAVAAAVAEAVTVELLDVEAVALDEGETVAVALDDGDGVTSGAVQEDTRKLGGTPLGGATQVDVPPLKFAEGAPAHVDEAFQDAHAKELPPPRHAYIKEPTSGTPLAPAKGRAAA